MIVPEIVIDEPAHNVGYQAEARGEHGFEEKKIEVYDPELEAMLTTPPLEGLSDGQVKDRILKFGYNGMSLLFAFNANLFAEIQEVKKSQILKFLGYFNGPIAWLIEASVILAGILKDWVC